MERRGPADWVAVYLEGDSFNRSTDVDDSKCSKLWPIRTDRIFAYHVVIAEEVCTNLLVLRSTASRADLSFRAAPSNHVHDEVVTRSPFLPSSLSHELVIFRILSSPSQPFKLFQRSSRVVHKMSIREDRRFKTQKGQRL